MSTPVLIDTSAWIEALRPEGDDALRREVRIAMEDGTAVLHRDYHFDRIREASARG